MHFTWPTIYLFTLYDRFEFKILVTIYIIECYLISKIPSTVIWYRFQQDITYRDLFIFLHFSGTWTFFKILWSVMSMCSFIALASLSWPYWSVAPLLLQGILQFESIDLLRFRFIIDYILQGLLIRAFTDELYHRVRKLTLQLICSIM